MLIAEWGKECPDLNADAMHIVGRIMQLGRRYEKEASLALKPSGLLYTDFDIIATLRRSGPPYELTPGQLSAAVLLTSGAMTAALDRLQNTGLITRHASEADRRVKTAKLTSQGKSLAKKTAQARFKVATKAVHSLSLDETRDLITLIKRLGS